MSYVSGRIPGYARCTATPAGRMNRLKHDETHPVVVDPAAARAAPRANISGALMTSARWSLAGSIVLAGLMVLVGLVTVPNLVPWGSQQRPIDPWAIGLIVVAGLATGLRRWPLTSFALCVGATSAYLLLGYPFGTILISVGVATYTMARRRPPRVAVLAGALALPLLLAHTLGQVTTTIGVSGLLSGAAWIIVPLSVGVTRRLIVETRQRQRADAERRALDDERLRLASEVHDIVGHGLAAIQMQADIARHVRDRKPEQAQIALDAISRASAQALAELRVTLASIADTRDQVPESRAPTPGLARVADLCARMRESGIDVTLTVSGTARTVDAGVDVAAYRIVQESLTNVAKHASQRHATVEIGYRPGTLHIDVTNPEATAGPVTEGFGIAGMRRRVADVGGTIAITAGDGEFRVAAQLPV